ncbi:hypothetical protein PVAP13_9NG255700 [Panicum virgatum]|uniref:Uncharacterized protein n=1 Tax=Panicum virgatum TaxID=38727 RepID=A0A8T0MPF2_PANVG|nr:hypothetical protein PVAP13_9NG255700 [Panicum virgatum]
MEPDQNFPQPQADRGHTRHQPTTRRRVHLRWSRPKGPGGSQPLLYLQVHDACLADSDAPGGRSAGARDANGETVAVVARRGPAAAATDRGHGRNSGSCRSIADGCRSCR